MMTYKEYKKLGFSLIGENEFERYITKAFLTTEHYTPNYDFTKRKLTPNNRRGVCEIAELYYCDDKQINKRVLSFSNEGYTESYGLPGNANIQTVEEKAYEIMRIYFTKEQLCRGV